MFSIIEDTQPLALHATDLCLLFFPVPRDPDLPAEQGSRDPEMVALLTALSQVSPSSKHIFEDLLGVSRMLNKSGIQICTLRL